VERQKIRADKNPYPESYVYQASALFVGIFYLVLAAWVVSVLSSF
jgi:hypothetical protein